MIFETTNERTITLIKKFIIENELSEMVRESKSAVASVYYDDIENVLLHEFTKYICDDFKEIVKNIDLKEFIDGLITNEFIGYDEHPTEHDILYALYREVFKDMLTEVFSKAIKETSILVDGNVPNSDIFKKVQDYIVDTLVDMAGTDDFIDEIESLKSLQEDLKIGQVTVSMFEGKHNPFKIDEIESLTVGDKRFITKYHEFYLDTEY